MATTRCLLLGTFLLVSSGASAETLSEGYCASYAAQAVKQTREYNLLQCSGGLGEWWSLEDDYHVNWCVTLPADSLLPAAGTASREKVLCGCRTTCATLRVHNNTDATLEVVVAGVESKGITTPPYTLAPVSVADVFVQFGRTQLFATAIRVSGAPQAVIPASVYKAGVYEIELFPRDFGVSDLVDGR